METESSVFFDAIRPMGCGDSWLPERLIDLDRTSWVAEPKYDGFRLVAIVYPTTVGFFTREMKRQDGKLDHVRDELMAKFPVGTVLDGEVVALRMGEDGKVHNRFERVQSVMLSKPERAMQIQRDDDDWLTFMVFDAMQIGDIDLRGELLETRREGLEFSFVNAGGTWKHVALSPHMAPTIQTYEHLTALGFEGIVVKDRYSTYVNKDSRAWAKIKAQHTVDVIVMGFHPGEGKYTGQIGSVKFGQPCPPLKVREWPEFVERGQCSGMTDDVRAYMTECQPDLVGTVIEITHMGVMHGGVKFRHPQFKRFRPEKPAKDVTWHDR